MPCECGYNQFDLWEGNLEKPDSLKQNWICKNIHTIKIVENTINKQIEEEKNIL